MERFEIELEKEVNMSDTIVVNKDTPSNQYDKLFNDGVLVKIRISVWGMGAQLSREDLGLETQIPKVFKLGKKMLIEPEHLNEFKNLESKARRYLYRNSYDFPISEAHFVPKSRYSEVIADLQAFKVEFETLVDKFIEKYPEYKEEVLTNYPDIADVLRPCYPEASDIKNKFGFSTQSFEISKPREFSETDIQKFLKKGEVKDEVKKRVETQLKSQYEDSVKQLEEFANNAIISLRSKLVNMCKLILSKIEKKELISKANLNTIKEEIANFRALNFLNDTAVAAEVNKLSTLVEGKHNFKTDQESIDALVAALNSVYQKAATISDVGVVSKAYFENK